MREPEFGKLNIPGALGLAGGSRLAVACEPNARRADQLRFSPPSQVVSGSHCSEFRRLPRFIRLDWPGSPDQPRPRAFLERPWKIY